MEQLLDRKKICRTARLLGAAMLAFLMTQASFGASLAETDSDPARTAQQIVDLHAHLFMPEGSGFPFFGDIESPLKSRRWSDRLGTRVNADSLKRSEVRIAVIALYSHPLFFGSQRDTVRRQIREASRFVKRHPEWAIALSPEDAQAKLKSGKRLLILSLEGMSGIIESEKDIQEFVDQLGVRIITPVHFSDDLIGGAGFMPGYKIIVNPVAALKSLFHPVHDETGVRINPHGLTPLGKDLVRSLIRHRAWIDLSHASDATFDDIVPLLKEAGQPLLFTHTVLRSAFRGERGISDRELQQVDSSRGIVGLLPSDDMLEGTVADPRFCPKACDGQCEGGVAAYLTQFHEMSRFVSPASIMMGSDVDAPLTFLKPGCKADAEANPRGLWDYAQLPELMSDLQRSGASPTFPPDGRVRVFLRAWSQATGGAR